MVVLLHRTHVALHFSLVNTHEVHYGLAKAGKFSGKQIPAFAADEFAANRTVISTEYSLSLKKPKWQTINCISSITTNEISLVELHKIL